MYTLVKHFTLLYQDIRANFEKHTCYCNSVGLGGPCLFLNQMYTLVKHFTLLYQDNTAIAYPAYYPMLLLPLLADAACYIC